VNQYASEIILSYRPRAVVLYAGDNDLSWPWSKTTERVFSDFKQLVEIIHAQLPETWIYYISMKPSPLRWNNWEKLRTTNGLIEGYCQTQERVQFIDVDAAMLDSHGKPRAELFRWDGLHMNSKGYAILTSIIKPVLLNRFAAGTRNSNRPSFVHGRYLMVIFNSGDILQTYILGGAPWLTRLELVLHRNKAPLS
jgi:lysophospholipase L1-like esterase